MNRIIVPVKVKQIEIIDVQNELFNAGKPYKVTDVMKFIKNKCKYCFNDCNFCKYGNVKNKVLKSRVLDSYIYRNLKQYGNAYSGLKKLNDTQIEDLKKNGFINISFRTTKFKTGIVIYANFKGDTQNEKKRR